MAGNSFVGCFSLIVVMMALIVSLAQLGRVSKIEDEKERNIHMNESFIDVTVVIIIAIVIIVVIAIRLSN